MTAPGGLPFEKVRQPLGSLATMRLSFPNTSTLKILFGNSCPYGEHTCPTKDYPEHGKRRSPLLAAMHQTTNVPFDTTLFGWIIVIFFGVMISSMAMVSRIRPQLDAASGTASSDQISSVISAVTPAFGQAPGTPSAGPIPPPYVFMIVWPVLYILIALALWHAYRVTGSRAWFWVALVGLVLNFLWMPVFLSNNGVSAALSILTLLIVVTAFQFVYLLRYDPFAAALYVPYLVWLLYAWSLNNFLVQQIEQQSQ